MSYKSLSLMTFVVVLTGCSATAVKPSSREAPPSYAAIEHIGFENYASSLVRTQQGQQSGNAEKKRKTPGENVHQPVRYIGVDATSWEPTNTTNDYSDLYTSIKLNSSEKDGAGAGGDSEGDGKKLSPLMRSYSAEDRNPISRFLSNKTDTVTTVINVSTHDPELTLVIPLFSLSHASGKDIRNSWSTAIAASNIDSPLFLISPNTRIAIHVSSKLSSDIKSQGTSIAIGAITSAIQIASPTSTLLTSLSKNDLNRSASAMDSAISSLLSREISEDIDVGRTLDSWTPSSRVIIYGCTPFARFETVVMNNPPQQDSVSCASDEDIYGGRDMPLGPWSLHLSCPRYSVFSPADICDQSGGPSELTLSRKDREKEQKKIAENVSDTQILSFYLSSQVSIQSFVQSQAWFTSFTSQKAKQDYDAFCASGITSMEMSGLNNFDAALVIRAVVDQLPQLSSIRSAFTSKAKGCGKQLAAVGVSFQ